MLEKQIRRLETLRTERDAQGVESALQALTSCAESGEGNLLELAVEAARRRATLGEISSACETVFGRYRSSVRLNTNVYQAGMEQNASSTKHGN